MVYKRLMVMVLVVTLLLSIASPANATSIEQEDQKAIPESVKPLELQTQDNFELIEYDDMKFKVPYLQTKTEPMISQSGYIEKYTEVPHYFQSIYPKVAYGSSTIKSGGCGIACVSMVLTYLLDEEVPITYLAKKYYNYHVKGSGSSYTLFGKSAEDFGVEAMQVWKWQNVRQALEEGHVCIANVKAPSIFTTGGHYIVLAGLTDEGKIIVKDPNLYNYNAEWNYPVREEGYANGFEDENLKYSCNPVWVYPKKDIEAVASRVEAGIPVISEENQ